MLSSVVAFRLDLLGDWIISGRMSDMLTFILSIIRFSHTYNRLIVGVDYDYEDRLELLERDLI